MKLHAVVFPVVVSLLSFKASAFEIIAHRGASGYVPEHTLTAAALAHAQGPDYIEQDVVLTKDSQLVVLHDIYLETVTNVETVFPERSRADGRWYVIDFTLEELRTLSVHEREHLNGTQVYPDRYQGNAHFSVATFDEHIELIQELNRLGNKGIQLYTEVKSPQFHRASNRDVSVELTKALTKHGLNTKDAPIIIQCFDFNELRRMRHDLHIKARLVQLLGENSWKISATDYDQLTTIAGVQKLAGVIDGIGPWIPQLFEQPAQGHSPVLASWLKEARSLGLFIHPYTLRTDAPASDMSTSHLLDWMAATGIAGVFTDQVPFVRKWRSSYYDNKPSRNASSAQ